jgi:hypothetical protein
MPLKVRSHAKTKPARNGAPRKHVAPPASFKSVLRTYGLTESGFKRLQHYVEKRLGHALTN